MRNIILISIFLSNIIVAQAQVRFGTRVGINLANMTNVTSGQRVGGVIVSENGEMVARPYAGVFAEIPVNAKLLLKPHLGYSGQGFRADAKTDFAGNTIIDKRNVTLHYINLSLPFTYSTGLGKQSFFVGMGPYAGVLVAGNTVTGGQKRSLYIGNGSNDELSRFDAGLSATTGFAFHQKFIASVDYNLGLLKLNRYSKTYNRVLGLGIGYRF